VERFQDLVGRCVKGRFKVLPLVGANVSTNAERDRGGGTHQRDKDNDPSASHSLSLARGQPFPLVFQLDFDLTHRDSVIAFGRFLQIRIVGVNAIHRVHLSRIVSKIKEHPSPDRAVGLFAINRPEQRANMTWRAILNARACEGGKGLAKSIYCLLELLPGLYRLVNDRPQPRSNQTVREALFTSFWAAYIFQESGVRTSMALLGRKFERNERTFWTVQGNWPSCSKCRSSS
jgi:hypothetical protein